MPYLCDATSAVVTNLYFTEFPENYTKFYIIENGQPRLYGREDLGMPKYRAVNIRRGVIVPEEYLPKQAVTKLKLKKIPDIFDLQDQLGVSQRFKDLVEELEPGKHQFIPLETLRADGEPISGQAYILNILEMVDSGVDPDASGIKPVDKSKPNWKYRKLVTPISNPTPEQIAADKGIFLKKDVVGGLHLWRDKRYESYKFFFSDILMEQYKKLKMTEIQETWGHLKMS